jgi:hypothetical protein
MKPINAFRISLSISGRLLRGAIRGSGVLAIVAVCALPVHAQQSDEALAKAAQNPIGDMISLPFQNNTNFNAGPKKQTQNVLNIQPVYPININSEWNVITRTIVPVISQPDFGNGAGRTDGIGDVQFSAFLSPARASGWIWGLGAIVQAPTATDDVLGQGKWALGPTAVALHLEKGDPWVYGALINNLWSVAGDGGRPGVNQMLLQPFVNYNFPAHPGRYLTFSPIITADWKADTHNQWTVPFGLGIGQIFRIGQVPVNASASLYNNVVRPDNGADWQLRLQLQFMFPK